MRSLPRSAQHYIILVWLCALGILVWDIPALLANPALGWMLLSALSLVTADYFEINLEVGSHSMVMTLAEAVIIFLVATEGWSAIAIIALGTSITEILRRRPWHRAMFNTAQRTIAAFAMVVVYTTFRESASVPFSTFRDVIVFFAVAATFSVTTTVLVGVVIALVSQSPLNNIYREGFALIEWIHLLTLPIGALMAAHWETNRWLLVFDVLVLLIAQRSFAIVAQLQAESHHRKELADERERLLLELQAQQEELIRASKLAALGTFSAGIAHEFNNLLTVILGQAQIGLVTSEPAEMRESLERMTQACRRGRTITQGLLTFARQGESQRVLTRLHEVITDTVGMVEHDFAQEQIQIVCDLAAVPPTACDPGQILQVLLNLLTNARDAMHERGGVITIRLYEDAGQIVLAVADTGSGIPPEVQAQLFQPFVTTKGNKGTGLGLAICYGIVESHKGAIQVESTPGAGTTFTIRLPIVDWVAPAIRLSPADEKRFAAATSSESTRIYT